MISTIIEILAVFAGLTQGILIMLNKKSNWYFYIIQMVLMVVFSAINNLWGDTFLNAVFICYGIWGLISWGSEETKISANITKVQNIIIVSLLCMTPVLYYVLTLTNDPLPFLDAFTTIGAFIATFLMVKRKIQTWVVWFVVDIFYVFEYFALPNQALYLMGLNIIWTGMAIASFINWIKIQNTQPIKIFIGAKYDVQHKDITPENADDKLKTDIRAKLIGIKNFLYPSNVEIVKGYRYIYNGGFYYEDGDGSQQAVVENELKEIDESDIIIFDFTKPGIVGTIAELFYAMSKNKKIVIFKNPKITTDKITSEYWFIFETLKKMKNYDNTTFYNAVNDDEVINIITNHLIKCTIK